VVPRLPWLLRPRLCDLLQLWALPQEGGWEPQNWLGALSFISHSNSAVQHQLSRFLPGGGGPWWVSVCTTWTTLME